MREVRHGVEETVFVSESGTSGRIRQGIENESRSDCASYEEAALYSYTCLHPDMFLVLVLVLTSCEKKC